jgi:hypothetical protein
MRISGDFVCPNASPLRQTSCRPDRIQRGAKELSQWLDTDKHSDRAVARLLPPESSAVQTVAQAVGVSAATLERWRSDALAEGKKSGG